LGRVRHEFKLSAALVAVKRAAVEFRKILTENQDWKPDTYGNRVSGSSWRFAAANIRPRSSEEVCAD